MADTLKTANEVLFKLQGSHDYDVCCNNVSMGLEQWQTLKKGNYRSELDLQYDWGLVIGLAIVLTFLLTYTYTHLKSSMGLKSKKDGREPPIVPYWIPFLGNLIPFIRDPFTYCADITFVFHLYTRICGHGH